jgi:hypothetical protein
VPPFHLPCGEILVVTFGDIAPARSGAPDEVPDRVPGGERPCRTNLADTHFVALAANLEKRVRVDPQAPAKLDRNRDLALLGDPVHLHVRKYYLS